MNGQTLPTGPVAAPTVLALAAMETMLTVLLLHHAFPAGFYNSDLVQPFLIARDMAQGLDEITQWHLSPAPYVFPDLMVAGLMQWVGLPLSHMPLIYGLALSLAMTASVAWLTGQLSGLPFVTAVAVTSVIKVLALICILHSPNDTEIPLYTSYHSIFVHSGAILFALVGLSLLIWTLGRQQARKAHWPLFTVFLVAHTATVASDPVALAWLTAPVLVLVLAGFLRSSSLTHVAQAIAIAVSAGLAVGLFYVYTKGFNIIYLQVQQLTVWQSAMAFVAFVQGKLTGLNPIYLLSVGVYFAVLVNFLRGLWRYRQTGQLDDATVFAGLVAVAMSASIALPIMAGQFSTGHQIRYFMGFFAFAFLALVRWTTDAAAKIDIRLMIMAQIVLICTLVAAWRVPVLTVLADPRPDDGVLNCLREEGLFAGYGDYWYAKLLIYLSDERRHVVQLFADAQLLRLNYDEEWFTHHAGTDLPLEPHFIITKGLDTDALDRRFGAPERVRDCQGVAIWIYTAPLPVLG